MGNVHGSSKVVFVYDPGVLGIVLSEHPFGYVVKWFDEGIEYKLSLEWDEFEEFEGGMDV